MHLAAGPRSERLTDHHPSLKKYRLLAPAAHSYICARAKERADRALTDQGDCRDVAAPLRHAVPLCHCGKRHGAVFGMEMFRSIAAIRLSQFSGTCRPNLYEDLTPCPIGTP